MSSQIHSTAILLAAGLSRRMGENKLLLPCNGAPLISHTVRLMDQFPFCQKIAVVNRDTAERYSFPDTFTVLVNEKPEKGQASSMALSLEHAEGDGYLFFMGDQPLLSRETVCRILDAARPDAIVVPEWNGTPGNPVYFGGQFKSELLAVQGDRGGRPVRDRNAHCCITVKAASASDLADIDTPEQYKNMMSA